MTAEELREKLSSGQAIFANRVAWSLTHTMHAGLIRRVGRGVYQITDAGTGVLLGQPENIDISRLREYPSYIEWTRSWGTSSQSDNVPPPVDVVVTPEEALERAAEELQAELRAEVLQRMRAAPPGFLESVVVDLMTRMGYGGGDPVMGRVTGGSGDGGIDGTIREDALGLDEVYVQAKRYADGATVGENALRNFAGAIDAAGTTKGVFVTTSGFTGTARKYVKRSPKRIALIDGEELARLMVLHNVGVRVRSRHEIKRIDEDYFDQDAV